MAIFHNDPSPLVPLTHATVGEWVVIVERPDHRYKVLQVVNDADQVMVASYGPNCMGDEMWMRGDRNCVVIKPPMSIETTTTLTWEQS